MSINEDNKTHLYKFKVTFLVIKRNHYSIYQNGHSKVGYHIRFYFNDNYYSMYVNAQLI
jgi:hypothetical protein